MKDILEMNDVSDVRIQDVLNAAVEEIQDNSDEYEVYYYPETGQSLAVRKYYIGQRLRVLDSFSQMGVAGVKFEIKNSRGLKLKYTTDAWGYTPYIYLNADDTFFYQM